MSCSSISLLSVDIGGAHKFHITISNPQSEPDITFYYNSKANSIDDHLWLLCVTWDLRRVGISTFSEPILESRKPAFGPRMDSGESSYRPPLVHISADTPWVNILSWSVNQMKSEGGIPLTRRERVASLEAVLVKKSRRKPLSIDPKTAIERGSR